ncbi:SAM and SH3 domain-containing protein 1-like isoform X4 [Ptychodera flava]|uniref:SAM and SH3 domain-containing protein 1-like isoform X4 n=2 Tax=Ptychodera flava TaxID=63121 RepID=UPI003969FE06
MAGNIVEEWLRSMDLLQYAEAFVDNGYDDLEICKQVGEPDLDAIGVENPSHRRNILRAVSRLREEGGTHVYFTLEQTENLSDSDSDHKVGNGDVFDNNYDYCYNSDREGSAPDRISYPKLQLRMMIRDKLLAEGINLSSFPFSQSDGSKGNIDDLSKRYAEEFKTSHKDVLDRMDELRKRRVSQDYTDRSPVIRSTFSSPSSVRSFLPEETYNADQFTEPLISSPESVRSQTANRSKTQKTDESGLSDGEVKRKGRIGKLLKKSFKKDKSSNKSKPVKMTEAVEFNASEITMSDDDRITLMNLVKEKAITIDQALARVKQYEAEKKKEKEQTAMQQPGTPTSQSADEVDDSSSPNRTPKHSSFKVRIPSLRKKKKSKEDRASTFYTNEGDNSPQKSPPLSPESISSPQSPKQNQEKLTHLYEEPPDSDTTTVDSSANQEGESSPVLENPTNQDTPSSSDIPYATIDSSMSKSETDESIERQNSGVSDGGESTTAILSSDEKLPQESHYVCIDDIEENSTEDNDIASRNSLSTSPNEKWDLPPSNGSNVEVSPTKSELPDQTEQTEHFSRNSASRRSNRLMDAIRRISSKGSISGTEEDSRSVVSTSENEESPYNTTEKMNGNANEQKRLTADIARTPSFLDKMKEVKKDVRKRIGRRLSSSKSRSISDQDGDYAEIPSEPSGSSESLRSSISGASGFSQHSNPSVSSGSCSSNRDSTASQDDDVPAYTGPFCAKARVHTDFTPSPYDTDSLRLKRGALIDVISMPPMGTWMGMLNNRVGTFKFIYVDIIDEEEEKKKKVRKPRTRRRSSKKLPKANDVEGLLKKINLEEYISVLMLNGYETLDLFKDIEDEDLDALNITNSEHRIKILTAAELLQYEDEDNAGDDADVQTDETQTKSGSKEIELLSTDILGQLTSSPRDSGCYASAETLLTRESPRSGSTVAKESKDNTWHDSQSTSDTAIDQSDDKEKSCDSSLDQSQRSKACDSAVVSCDQERSQSEGAKEQAGSSTGGVCVQVRTAVRDPGMGPSKHGYFNVEIKNKHDYVNIEVYSKSRDDVRNDESPSVNVSIETSNSLIEEICHRHEIEEEEVARTLADCEREVQELVRSHELSPVDVAADNEPLHSSPSFHELVSLYEATAANLSPGQNRRATVIGGPGIPGERHRKKEYWKNSEDRWMKIAIQAGFYSGESQWKW